VVQDLERFLERPDSAPRVEGWPDPTLRLHRRDAMPPECQVELRRDLRGFTVYGTLAWRNPLGLDSGIVYARDLHERNELLLSRYRGWELWRYAPPEGAPLAMPVLSRITPADAISPVAGSGPPSEP
jgi:hypothetical protein